MFYFSRFYVLTVVANDLMENILNDETTGVILVGGKNNRMGVNKALLKIDDTPIIDRSLDLLGSIFKSNIICTNDPVEIEYPNIQTIKDSYQNFGPLAGIHSALKKSDSQKVFVISCDMPFLTPSVIKHLLNIKTQEAIVLPCVDKNVEYLCGIYSKDLLPLLENVLSTVQEAKVKNNDVTKSALSIWNFVERVGAEIVDIEMERFYFSDMFFRINTQEDYEYVLERL